MLWRNRGGGGGVGVGLWRGVTVKARKTSGE